MLENNPKNERELREGQELFQRNRDNFFNSIAALIKQFSQNDLNYLRKVIFHEVRSRRGNYEKI
jgi:hypothetical protein